MPRLCLFAGDPDATGHCHDDQGRWTSCDQAGDGAADILAAGTLAREERTPTVLPGFPPSRAEVSVRGSEQAARQVLGTILPGRTLQDLASVVGAPDKAIVEVGLVRRDGKDCLEIHVRHTDIDVCKRTLATDARGEPYVHNDEFFLTQEAQGRGGGGGLALTMFGRQIYWAQQMGCAHIATYGGRREPEYKDEAGNPVGQINGYYTWPRFGYDCPVEDLQFQGRQSQARNDLISRFPGTVKLSDLMAHKRGRDWWKKHGGGVSLRFDLSAGSKSCATFAAYHQERQERPERRKAGLARRAARRRAGLVYLDGVLRPERAAWRRLLRRGLTAAQAAFCLACAARPPRRARGRRGGPG